MLCAEGLQNVQQRRRECRIVSPMSEGACVRFALASIVTLRLPFVFAQCKLLRLTTGRVNQRSAIQVNPYVRLSEDEAWQCVWQHRFTLILCLFSHQGESKGEKWITVFSIIYQGR